MTLNDIRAHRAAETLKYYIIQQRGEIYEQHGTEIIDLIADLLHLSKRLTIQHKCFQPPNILYTSGKQFDVQHGDNTQEMDKVAT